MRHSDASTLRAFSDFWLAVRQLAYPLTDGGTALLFWGFLALIVGMGMVYASLAEMASMYEISQVLRSTAYDWFKGTDFWWSIPLGV